MLPSPGTPENRIDADATLALGDGSSASEWVVSAPFGTEMVVALASTKPIFQAPRDEVEGAEGYLRDLRRILEDMDQNNPAGRVVADVLFVTTTAGR